MSAGIGAMVLCLCQPRDAVCLPSTTAALAVRMLDAQHVPSCAALAAPAMSVFSSCPGKWILNISMQGWTNPQSSLGKGKALVSCRDVQKLGAFKPLTIFPVKTSLCLSFWASGETWLGLAPIFPGLHMWSLLTVSLNSTWHKGLLDYVPTCYKSKQQKRVVAFLQSCSLPQVCDLTVLLAFH